jgi:hypothetical protein
MVDGVGADDVTGILGEPQDFRSSHRPMTGPRSEIEGAPCGEVFQNLSSLFKGGIDERVVNETVGRCPLGGRCCRHPPGNAAQPQLQGVR